MDIQELITQTESATELINKLQQGRNAPVYDKKKALSELIPKEHKVMNHALRPDKEVQTSQTDASGNPITKTVKVARISVGLQKLIVNRAVSFLFGNEPRLYSDQDNGDTLTLVKRALADAKARSLNRKLARDVFSVTEAAEIWYLNETEPHDLYGFNTDMKLRCMLVSPMNGNELYPYFDEKGDMVAFSRQFYIDNTKTTYFETYTDTTHYLWALQEGDWKPVEGYPKEHGIGKIPVVYSNQPKPEWEDVQPLIERLETLLSNFADTNDYHASPKIFVTGQVTGFSQKGEAGAIIEGEQGATAQYLSWTQAPESVKLEISTLLNLIYTTTQTPDISFDNVKGLNTSGVALKLLFFDAHLKVQDKAETFDAHLQRRVNVIKAMLASIAPANVANQLRQANIEPEIVPYMIEDDQANVNTLMSATGQKAIMSRRTAVEALGYVNNTDEELERIESEDAQSQVSNLFEPTE